MFQYIQFNTKNAGRICLRKDLSNYSYNVAVDGYLHITILTHAFALGNFGYRLWHSEKKDNKVKDNNMFLAISATCCLAHTPGSFEYLYYNHIVALSSQSKTMPNTWSVYITVFDFDK